MRRRRRRRPASVAQRAIKKKKEKKVDVMIYIYTRKKGASAEKNSPSAKKVCGGRNERRVHSTPSDADAAASNSSPQKRPLFVCVYTEQRGRHCAAARDSITGQQEASRRCPLAYVFRARTFPILVLNTRIVVLTDYGDASGRSSIFHYQQ